MTLNAQNVHVAVTGTVSVAPAGTTLPTDAVTPLSASWTDVGYISDSGITESVGVTTTDITAWQNASLIRRAQTAHALTYQFEMLETTLEALSVYYGGGTSSLVTITANTKPIQPFCFDIIDGTTEICRIVVPYGQPTAFGDVDYKNGAAMSYQVTISAYADSTGAKSYMYWPNLPAA